MKQTLKCPQCGTENPIKEKYCSACKSDLQNLMLSTRTFISPDKIKSGPEIDIDGLKEGEEVVLVIKKGPILGQRITLPEGETLIGRDPKSGIFLNDITVSRRHAKITNKDKNSTVKDLGSLNGTYLNGERFTEEKLKNRDELQIGKYVLVYLCK